MSSLTNAIGKLVFWVFQWIFSKILSVVHSETPKTIPTIKSSVLMESASSLANKIRNKKVTSVEVIKAYAERIQEVNKVLNCVVEDRFEEALKEAEKVDEIIRAGGKSPDELESETPFLGVPFTAPESMGIRGLSNTMGCWNRKNIKAETDADIVALMRKGGAIPLACTNISELCFAYETNNSVYGRTNNPYDTNRSAGGPFGGEASLIASSGSPLGLAPSVAVPCAFNGIFGHKTSSQHIGLMSRSAIDLLPALKLLSNNSSLNLEEEVDIKKLKYYFPKENVNMKMNEDIKDATRKTMNHLKNVHKAFVSQVSLENIEKAYSIYKGRAPQLNKVGDINLRKEIIKAFLGKSQHTINFLLTVLLDSQSSSTSSEQINHDYNLLLKQFQSLLDPNHVFIWPIQQPAFRHNESLVRRFELSCTAFFEFLGLPTTYCPVGLDSEGLPIGFQVIGGINQDRLTLAVAKEIDKVFGGWKPPPTHGIFTLKNTIFLSEANEKVKTL